MSVFGGLWAKTLRESVETPTGGVYTRTTGTYSLERHLLDTAGAAYALWDVWLRPGLRTLIARAIADGDEAVARNIVAAVAGLHDIGKANAVFQTQAHAKFKDPYFTDIATALREQGFDTETPGIVENAGDEAKRHEALSQAILSGFPESLSSLVGDGWVGAVVGGHHGRYHPQDEESCPLVGEALSRLMTGKWGDAQTQLVQRVLSACGVTEQMLRRPIATDEGVVIVLITGLVILADWLASDGIDASGPEPTNAEQYVRRKTRHYRTTMPRTVGVYKNPTNPQVAVMGSVRTRLHPLQQDATGIGRGLWIVAETTGSGKTEAAMLRHTTIADEGVIWGLPTRATADKMWDRIQRMYRRTRNIAALLHAHRSLNGFYFARNDEAHGLFYTEWAYKVLANIKPLLSPVAVGTVDQVLLAALRQKWNPVRLLAVANKHVILDEAHTYDEYQLQLVEELLAWWGKTDTRVTLLSASLPRVMIRRFAEAYNGSEPQFDHAIVYPAHTLVHDGQARVTPLETARRYELDIDMRSVAIPVNVVPEAALASAAAQTVLQLHEEHPRARIAVIMNRVDTCAEVAAMLMYNGILDVTVMHSRMAAGHRTELSNRLEAIAGKQATTSGSIVIGTQVIEASLDLDFDLMVTELAPAASLIQRAGRLWRSSTPTPDGWVHTIRDQRPTPVPRLVVLSPTDEYIHNDEAGGQDFVVDWAAVSQKLALPYTAGALSRTKQHLPQRLAIPEGVQDLVDVAHFDSSESVVADSEELRRENERLIAAGHAMIGARRENGIFASEVSYAHLRDLTAPDPLEESATRYTDYEQVTVLLLDPTGTNRWAWRGSKRVLKSLATTRHRDVAHILSKTIRVPADFIPKYLEKLDVPDSVRVFAASELQDVHPVFPRKGAAFYDEILGLRVKKAAGHLLSAGMHDSTAVESFHEPIEHGHRDYAGIYRVEMRQHRA